MERVGRIAMHLVPAPATGPLLAAPCAGWKILPGPHPTTSNAYTVEVKDEKAFLAFVDESMKKMKGAGGPLPAMVQIYKMDSGLFMMNSMYANDMDRVANMARGRKIRGEAPTEFRVIEMSSWKTEWFVSVVDERPIKMTGSRVATIYMAFKSPEHLEKAMKLNPNGDLTAAFGAEYRKAGVKGTGMMRCSDTSVVGLTVLSDEAAYLKGREEVMAKVVSAMGVNLMDYLVAPPERDVGTCVYAKMIDEI